MANGTSLKSISNAQREDEERAYRENVAPMQPDIDEFVEILENYCRTKNRLELRIIYRVKNESMLRFFGKPISGNQIIISEGKHIAVKEAWKKLLTKWYFTANGEYLYSAVNNECLKKGIMFEHDDEDWGRNKDMVNFTVW